MALSASPDARVITTDLEELALDGGISLRESLDFKAMDPTFQERAISLKDRSRALPFDLV